jgi:hypothetical protein
MRLISNSNDSTYVDYPIYDDDSPISLEDFDF